MAVQVQSMSAKVMRHKSNGSSGIVDKVAACLL
jgi:hypothetical protein